MTVKPSKTLEAIRYSRGSLEILDQLLLPHQTAFIPIRSVDDAYKAIKLMQVRGAPAIAIVAALSLAVELQSAAVDSASQMKYLIRKSLEFLKSISDMLNIISFATYCSESLYSYILTLKHNFRVPRVRV